MLLRIHNTGLLTMTFFLPVYPLWHSGNQSCFCVQFFTKEKTGFLPLLFMPGEDTYAHDD